MSPAPGAMRDEDGQFFIIWVSAHFTACAIFCGLSAIGVARYGWVNLADEFLCGVVVLWAWMIGTFIGGKDEDHDKIVFAETFGFIAFAVGLVIGALFPPWSTAELVAIGVASTLALMIGFFSARECKEINDRRHADRKAHESWLRKREKNFS